MVYLGLLYLVVLSITHGPVRATAECTMKPNVNTLLMKIGETVSIYCSSGTGLVSFWKDNKQIDATEGTMVAHEKVFRIFNVSSSNDGLYECRTVSETVKCDSITLKVHDEIRFVKETTEKFQYVKKGRTVSLNCTAKSSNDIVYEWYHGGRKILDDDKISTDGGLKIVAIEIYNKSIFTCRATLPDFSYFKDLNITVTVLEGEPLTCIKCNYVGVGSSLDEEDSCVSASSIITERERCESSCVAISAAGPAEQDGTHKYASFRGCGDRLSILKERCVTLPTTHGDAIKLSALSMFGESIGLTRAKICFCSSGDRCNNVASVDLMSGGTRASLAIGTFISMVIYSLMTRLQ